MPDRRSSAARNTVAVASGIVPGLIAGFAAVAAVRFARSRKRRNNSPYSSVLPAEVHSNGHSKVKLNSLDSFS
ncbi:MAG TPA: hypothetical protein VHJ78_05290 [Actinomycetota bacterium]|nr:hypothetical protein [Actinomycetota bacterium]